MEEFIGRLRKSNVMVSLKGDDLKVSFNGEDLSDDISQTHRATLTILAA